MTSLSVVFIMHVPIILWRTCRWAKCNEDIQYAGYLAWGAIIIIISEWEELLHGVHCFLCYYDLFSALLSDGRYPWWYNLQLPHVTARQADTEILDGAKSKGERDPKRKWKLALLAPFGYASSRHISGGLCLICKMHRQGTQGEL